MDTFFRDLAAVSFLISGITVLAAAKNGTTEELSKPFGYSIIVGAVALVIHGYLQ